MFRATCLLLAVILTPYIDYFVRGNGSVLGRALTTILATAIHTYI